MIPAEKEEIDFTSWFPPRQIKINKKNETGKPWTCQPWAQVGVHGYGSTAMSQVDRSIHSQLHKKCNPKVTPKWPQSDPEMIPKWPQSDIKVIPKWHQSDPKVILEWHQNDPKTNTKWCQSEPKMIPKRSQSDLAEWTYVYLNGLMCSWMDVCVAEWTYM